MVVIAPSGLVDAAQDLAAVHESEGLRSAVIDLQDVYDTFSDSLQTPLAIRDFLAYRGRPLASGAAVRRAGRQR